MADTTRDPETPYEGGQIGESNERQGHLFFFKICDMRVATIGMNIFNIGLLALGMVFKLAKFQMFISFQAAIPSIVLSAIAIFGAINFELWAVAMAAGFFALGVLIDLFWVFKAFNFFGLVFGLLVLYPTAMMTYEMHHGIITKETYRQRTEYINFAFVEKMGIKKSYLTEQNDNTQG